MLHYLHFEPFHATVLDGIVQRLLENSKEAKTDVQWQSTADIIFEIDFHSLTFTELHAPASYPRNDTQNLKL